MGSFDLKSDTPLEPGYGAGQPAPAPAAVLSQAAAPAVWNQTARRPLSVSRGMQLGLALTGVLWAIVATSAAGLMAAALGLFVTTPAIADFLRAIVLVVLLLVGFTAIAWAAVRERGLARINALPARATSGAEWRAGAALGWAMALLAVLPMMIGRAVQPVFNLSAAAWSGTVVSVLLLATLALGAELLWRGFLLVRLGRVIGLPAAALVLSAAAALFSARLPDASWSSVAATFLLGLLLSTAYARTHALWLGWGLHFGWLVALGVIFGLPTHDASYVSVVQSNDVGPLWLTGGFYGPAGSWVSVAIILLAFMAVYAITRDWAWAYTHPVPVGAAYAVVVQPPAQHTAMEATAAPAPGLVQILGQTPAQASTLPAINEHLRDTQ